MAVRLCCLSSCDLQRPSLLSCCIRGFGSRVEGPFISGAPANQWEFPSDGVEWYLPCGSWGSDLVWGKRSSGPAGQSAELSGTPPTHTHTHVLGEAKLSRPVSRGLPEGGRQKSPGILSRAECCPRGSWALTQLQMPSLTHNTSLLAGRDSV